jgi:hypothetical protein
MMSFIFEIQADCSLKCKDNNGDMNYFHIEQHEDGTYSMYIDTMIFFENKRAGEINYLESIMIKLSNFMLIKGIDIDNKLSFSDVFNRGYNINTCFNNLEDLYTTFRYLVLNYKNNL